MIFIIDNNQSYSDHTLYIVEQNDIEIVQEVVDALGYFIILVAGKVEWYDGKPCSLASVIAENLLYDELIERISATKNRCC